MQRLREAVKSVLIKRGFEFTLKEKQLECISSIVCGGRDVLAVLPTGYGKSVIYQILPDVFDIMLGTEKSMVLVISPLNALMQDQITKLKDRGISYSLVVTCPYFLISSTIFSLVAISPNKSTLLRLTIYALQHYNASLRITVTVKTTRYSTFVFSVIYADRIKIELNNKTINTYNPGGL